MKFPLINKKTSGEKVMLNLACGLKTSVEWINVDFSPYALLMGHPWLVRVLRIIGVLSESRHKNLLGLSGEIVYWDLTKGLPLPDESCDVIYCAHFIEHLYKDSAVVFLRECSRVLTGC